AARHEPRKHPLPDRVRELERRAPRRPRRAGAALHRLPLHRGCVRGGRRRGGVDEAGARARPLRAARGAARVRGGSAPLLAVRAARGGRARARAGERARGAAEAVKAENEIAAISRAARAADRAFEALSAETWVGRSERELAWRLRQLLHANGVDELAFEIAI